MFYIFSEQIFNMRKDEKKNFFLADIVKASTRIKHLINYSFNNLECSFVKRLLPNYNTKPISLLSAE